MRKLICFLATGIFLLCTTCVTDPADFAPELQREKSFSPDVENAIGSGITWLLTTINSDGSFGDPGEEVAKTALAVTKLCDRSVELGEVPLEGRYATQIENGLNYIFEHAVDNAPYGIYLTTGGHSVYNTGIAMMAIAAARCPDCGVGVSGFLNGKTFTQVLQATVDFFEAAQNDDGGWRYEDHSEPSDNSNTGFAVLGLMAAEGAGCIIPVDLKPDLNGFINAIQDANGGSWYVINTWPWINTLKTGNLLFEMAFVGDAPDASRVLNALDYIGNHWNVSNDDPGWRNNYMAMYCLMKGLVSMGIETITVGSTEVNWYDDFVLEILGDPAVPDPWPLPSARWTNGTYLSSIFALLTLEKITPVPFIHVNIDVKPTSCPNPLNVKGNGVLPVAILGSDDFDVNDIDVSLVRLAGVAPLRSSIEDVAAPVVDPEECECTTAGADEFYDLTLKFDKQSIVDALDPFVDGEEVTLEITGELLDGTPFIGSDCIIIKAKK